MKRLLFLFGLLLQAGGQPIAIPIQNPSFEAPVNFTDSHLCGSANHVSAPGWNFIGSGSGIIKWTCGPVPDGTAVAYLSNATAFQDLGVKPEFGIYTLHVFLANWYYPYPAQYTVSLTMGGKPICPISGYALGDFTEVILPCPMSNYFSIYHGLGFDGNIGVSIANNTPGMPPGWTLLVDKVSLTFTPESQ